MKEIAELIRSTPLWITAVAVAVYMLVQGRVLPWIEYMSKLRSADLPPIQPYVAKDASLSPTTKALLLDLLEAKLLQKASGIYAEAKTREALKNLIEQTSEKVDWRTIRLAWAHLELREGRLRMKRFSVWRHGWWILNYVLLFGLLVLAMFGFIGALYVASEAPGVALILTIYGVALASMASIPRAEVHSVRAARRVEEEILSPSASPAPLST